MANRLEDKPPLPGYGTPFVNLYDRDKRLILELVLPEDRWEVNSGNDTILKLALSDFSYTFNETEDDKGNITLTSDSPDFMDLIFLRKNSVLYIEWGYLGGDKRPLLRVLIRNFKEAYTTDGYSLSLELSDNYAPSKASKNPVRARLEEVYQSLTASLDDPDANDKIQTFLNPIPEYNPIRPTIESLVEDGVIEEFSWEPSKDTPDGKVKKWQEFLSLPLDSSPEPGFTPVPFGEALKKQKEISKRYSTLDKATLDFYRGLGYPEGYLPPPLSVDSLAEPPSDTTLAKSPTNHHVVGGNAGNLLEDALNQTTPEPVAVSGSDGQVKISKRRRVSLYPPITEYTFRGGDGRLLEFKYDSDASYDDDESVLRTISVNPETGAVEVTDYANTVRKLEDAFNPQQFEQAKFENRTYEAALAAAIDGNPINVDPNQPVEEAINTPMLIQWGTHRNITGDLNIARDNTAVVTQFRSLPISDVDKAKELIENEIKNLKAEDSFRVRAIARTIGDPHVSNGVNILIKGLSKARTGTYHITSCTHTINISGYTNSYEMYKVSDIPANVDVLKKGSTNTDIQKDIETKNNTLLSTPELAKLQTERGYLLPQDLSSDPYYKKMDELDKDWIIKVGYTEYILKYVSSDNIPSTYKIRVPNDPRSPGVSVSLDSIIGIDELYRLIGVSAIGSQQSSSISISKYVPAKR